MSVFDVNETLLDLQALDPVFQTLLGDARPISHASTPFIMMTIAEVASALPAAK